MVYGGKRRFTKKRTTRRRRTYKKRAGGSRKLATFRPQRLLRFGFPRTTMVKLRYVQGITLDAPAIGTCGTYAFSANSCYDPNTSGVGHQPMNFDQWSALYNHYVVVGSKIRATMFPSSSTSGDGGFIFGINLQDDQTILNLNPDALMEQSLTRFKMGQYTPTVGSGRGITVSKGFSCKKFFNLNNPTDNVTRIGAAVNANPSDQAQFMIIYGPTPSSTVDPLPVWINVVIDYIVIFSEPKEQNQS